MSGLRWAVGIGAVLAAALAWSAQNASPAAKDPVLQAMHDEIERSRGLKLANLEAPYFIEYLVDESETFTVSATLGGIVARRREHGRAPSVRVRVGSYEFDNANWVGSGMPLATQYALGAFPVENAYAPMRRFFWLATDSAYKSAVEAISRKRAAMRNMNQTEELHDFARTEPVHLLRDFRPLKIDEDAWAARVRGVSGQFAAFPEVLWSEVDLQSSEGGTYLANSEGTEVRVPESVTYLRLRATGEAPDGMPVRDGVTFHSVDAMHLPGDPEVARAVNDLGANVAALAQAPRGEDYNGPVLFEGMAGAQIFAELLGKNLAPVRRPVAEGGRGGQVLPSDLEGRIGARVLPDSFDVLDDPTQKEWRGRPLFGSYEVDREGVVAKPVRLVEKGVLKSFLLTRQPVKGFEGSNGRARMPGPFGAGMAGVSNLFVSSSEAVPAAELKKKLIELARARGKDYALIVRKMDFPSFASADELRRMILAAAQGGGRPVSMPLLVYKVFPDGKEQLVRGLRFRSLSARSLRDIVAAGDDSSIFEFMDNSAPFAMVGASNFFTEAAVIAPSVLIDDVELRPAEGDYPKLPVVPPPSLTR